MRCSWANLLPQFQPPARRNMSRTSQGPRVQYRFPIPSSPEHYRDSSEIAMSAPSGRAIPFSQRVFLRGPRVVSKKVSTESILFDAT